MKHRIVVMPGDGIGRIVIPQALAALDAVGFPYEAIPADIGWDCWRRDGQALPERTLALLREHRLGLFGAITSRPAAEAEAALPPALQGRGHRYVSPVLAMRRQLRLDVAIRPVRTWPGVPSCFVRQRPGAPEALERPHLDAAVIMQNTEGLYAGVEWPALPAALRQALDAHPQMAALFADVPDEDIALSCRVLSRGACERVARAAFDYAARLGYQRVTVVDKWGVMNATADRLLDAARVAHAEHQATRNPALGPITLDHENVDTLLMRLGRTPERYQVLLCGALVGDLVSDALAGLTGGLGYAPCANLGEACAVFEPVHGSAPHLAELAANDPAAAAARIQPAAAILAAALLCDHVGDPAAATALRRRVSPPA